MLTNFRKTLLTSALVAIPAIAVSGAVTTADAGKIKVYTNTVKVPKPKVKVPKPRIRVVKPKIRIRPQTKQLAKKQFERKVDPESATTDRAEKAGEGTSGAQAAREIKTVDPVIREIAKVEPGNALTGDGDGNSSKKAGWPLDMSPDEFADRFGAAKTAAEIAKEFTTRYNNLGNRGVSSPASNWSRSNGVAPDPHSIPMGGLASTKTKKTPGLGAMVTKTVNLENDNSASVEKTWESEGTARSQVVDYVNGAEFNREESAAFNDGSRSDTVWDPVSGRGTTRLRDRNGEEEEISFGFYPEQWNRTKTGEEEGGVAPPPNCNTTACNAMRKGVSVRNAGNGGVRVNPGAGAGADGTTPSGSAPSVTTYINQDDLVKTNVAGDANSTTTNRVQRVPQDGGKRY